MTSGDAVPAGRKLAIVITALLTVTAVLPAPGLLDQAAGEGSGRQAEPASSRGWLTPEDARSILEQRRGAADTETPPGPDVDAIEPTLSAFNHQVEELAETSTVSTAGPTDLTSPSASWDRAKAFWDAIEDAPTADPTRGVPDDARPAWLDAEPPFQASRSQPRSPMDPVEEPLPEPAGVEELEGYTPPPVPAITNGASYDPHPTITIKGDDGFATCTCVRSGSGTAEDPYIISGWEITLTDGATGITILDTRAHAILRGNLLHGPEDTQVERTQGVWFQNATNITLEDNAILDVRTGIEWSVHLDVGDVNGHIARNRIDRMDVDCGTTSTACPRHTGLLLSGEGLVLRDNFVDATPAKYGAWYFGRWFDAEAVTSYPQEVPGVVVEGNTFLVGEALHAVRGLRGDGYIFEDNVVNGVVILDAAGTARNNTVGHLSVGEGPSLVEGNRLPGHLGFPWGGGMTIFGDEITARDNHVENVTRGTGILDKGDQNIIVDNEITVRGADPDNTRGFETFREFIGIDAAGTRALIEGNTIRHLPLDHKPFWIHKRETTWGIVATPFFPADGRNEIRSNTVHGFDLGIGNGFSSNNTYADNSVDGANWALAFDGARHQTLRNNTFTGVRYGFDLTTYTIWDAEHDIDTSNTVDGHPMLHQVVDADEDFTFDGDVQHYEYIGLVRAGNVTVRDMEMSRSGIRLFLLDVGNVTLEDNRFSENLASAAVFQSDEVVARNNTFHDDWVSLWTDRTPATVLDNDFTSSVPPGWYPSDRGWIGVLVLGPQASGSEVAGNTFQNYIAPVQVIGAEGVRVEDNLLEGAGFGFWLNHANHAVVRNNTLDWPVFGIVDINIGDGLRIEDNIVTRALTVGIVSRYRPDSIARNVVTTATFGIWLGDDHFTSFQAASTVEQNIVLADQPGTAWAVGMITSFVSFSSPDVRTVVASNVVHPGTQGIAYVDQHSHCTGSDTVRVDDNTFSESLIGVVALCSRHDQQDPPHHRIRHNRIEGNDIGLIHAMGGGNGTLDATNNWWGHASGPFNPDWNPNGTGDPVVSDPEDRVDVGPWLNAPPLSAAKLPLELSSSSETAKAGTDVSFTLRSTDGTTIDRAWVVASEQRWPSPVPGDGSDGIRFDHAFSAPGEKTLVVAAQGADGRPGMARLNLTVQGHAPTFDPSGDETIYGEPTGLDAGYHDPDGYPVSVTWAFGDGSTATWSNETGPSTSSTGSTGASTASAGDEPASPPASGLLPSDWMQIVEPDDGRTVAFLLTDGEPSQWLDRIEARYGTVLDTYRIIDGLAVYVREDSVAALEAEPWVRAVDVVETPVSFALQTTGEALGRPSAVDLGLTGRGVGIAVLDTGINTTHPDLADRVVHQREIDSNKRHGTAMAGALAGTGQASAGLYTGMAPQANLLDLPIAPGPGALAPRNFEGSWITNGWTLHRLDWIAEHHEEYNIRVIYTGQAVPCASKSCHFDTLEDALENIVDLGIVVVAPAGNRGTGQQNPRMASITQPALYDAVLGVGAVDDHNVPDEAGIDVTSWSGRGGMGLGPVPDLLAPGVHVTTPNLGDGYLSASGTSVSAAQVAGIVALMMEKDPSLTPAQVREVLTSTARKLAADDGPTPNPHYGWGLVDAEAAIEALDGRTPMTPSHVYDEPGVYTAEVEVTDDLGTVNRTTFEVPVHGVIPDFTIETLDPETGEPVTFQDASTALEGANLSYAWDFGDGSTGTGATVNHTYTTAGTYEVTISVTETGYGTWSTSTTLEVNTPPVVEAPMLAEARPGQALTVWAHANDTDGPEEVTWQVRLDEPVSPPPTVTTHANQSVAWTWQVPEDWAWARTLTFTADDGADVVSAVTEIVALDAPSVTLEAPIEHATGTASDTVITDEPIQLRAIASDPDGNVTDVSFYPHGLDNASLNASLVDGVYVANATYTTVGEPTLAVRVEDDDGVVRTQTRQLVVVENTPPLLEAPAPVAGNATGPQGLHVNLSVQATDPEDRPLPESAYVWTLPGSAREDGTPTTVTGSSLSEAFPVGEHEVGVSVTDANGATSTATVPVVVDDAVFARVELVRPVDRDVRVTERPLVLVEVLDDRDQRLADASAVLSVTHASIEEPVSRLEVEMNSDGYALVALPHDVEVTALNGVNLPGEHTVTVEVEEPSRAGAPVGDVERAWASLGYLVSLS